MYYYCTDYNHMHFLISLKPFPIKNATDNNYNSTIPATQKLASGNKEESHEIFQKYSKG